MRFKIALTIVSILAINVSCTKPSEQEANMYSNGLMNIIDDLEEAFANLDKRIDQLGKTTVDDSLLKISLNEIELIEVKISSAQAYLDKKKGFHGDTKPKQETAKLIDSASELLPHYSSYFTSRHELLSQKKGETISNKELVLINENLIKIYDDIISALEKYSIQIESYDEFMSDWLTQFKNKEAIPDKTKMASFQLRYLSA